MKKHKKIWWIVLAVVLVIILAAAVFAFVRYTKMQDNPITKRLESLADEKITACSVTWLGHDPITYKDFIYNYQEKDPEKVQAVYNALCHLRVKEVPYNPMIGGKYCDISFTREDGTEISIFSYYDGHAITGKPNYMCEFLNSKKLEKDYGLWTIIEEMKKKAEAEKDVTIIDTESYLLDYQVVGDEVKINYHVTIHNARKNDREIQLRVYFYDNKSWKYTKDFWSCDEDGETASYIVVSNATEEFDVFFIVPLESFTEEFESIQKEMDVREIAIVE